MEYIYSIPGCRSVNCTSLALAGTVFVSIVSPFNVNATVQVETPLIAPGSKMLWVAAEAENNIPGRYTQKCVFDYRCHQKRRTAESIYALLPGCMDFCIEGWTLDHKRCIYNTTDGRQI